MKKGIPTIVYLLLLSCGGKQEKILPRKTNITESVYSSVTVHPDSLYQVYAAVAGILDRNLVEEGDTVQKGTPLLQIINTTPKLNTENAKLTLQLARENYSGRSGEIVNTMEPLASVGSDHLFIIELLVDEVDIVKLTVSQKVLVTLDAYPNEVFRAEISKIYPRKDERSQTFKLDSHNSENVFNIFKRLTQDEGLSLLVVTHDEDFAKRTDRIIEMEDGRIVS